MSSASLGPGFIGQGLNGKSMSHGSKAWDDSATDRALAMLTGFAFGQADGVSA